MEKTENIHPEQSEVEILKARMAVGDYLVASKMLNTTTENVRMRLIRKKRDVIECLTSICDNRDQLIQNYNPE